MWKQNHTASGEKLVCVKSSATGCIVIVQHQAPRVPQIELFSSNVLTQKPQNTAVKLAVHSPTIQDKFLMDNTTTAKKDNEHALCQAVDMPSLSLVVEMLGFSAAKTVASSQSCMCTPKFQP